MTSHLQFCEQYLLIQAQRKENVDIRLREDDRLRSLSQSGTHQITAQRAANDLDHTGSHPALNRDSTGEMA